MLILPYFLLVIPSALAAFILWQVIRRFTVNWSSLRVFGWQNIAAAVLRAFPIAIGFAPTLAMDPPFGGLVPVSFVLAGFAYKRLATGRGLQAVDLGNVALAVICALVLWMVLASVLFVRHSLAVRRRAANDPRV